MAVSYVGLLSDDSCNLKDKGWCFTLSVAASWHWNQISTRQHRLVERCSQRGDCYHHSHTLRVAATLVPECVCPASFLFRLPSLFF